jgi:dihydropteroate synthase
MLRVGPLEFESPAVMGVLNVTPDSFSDGGLFADPDAAIRQAERMVLAGAAFIDVGGESTRPGADDVGEQEELERVVPVVSAICREFDVHVSVDTSKPEVMRAAVAAGAVLINDVRALQFEGAMAAAVELQKPVCLMHMLGKPRTMQDEPSYDDVVADVTGFLQERVAQCRVAGLPEEFIIVDPGFGFGKTVRHNLQLLAGLRDLKGIGRPVLAGLSRKSTLAKLTNRSVDELMPASITAAVIAVANGADIVRVHDVAETIDALKVLSAVTNSKGTT